MIDRTTLSAAALLALLAACGGAEEAAAPAETAPAAEKMAMDDHAGMDHSAAMQADGLAPATGTIVEIEEGGTAALIDHAPIDAIGMGAMAMRFGTLGGVDFSGFKAGDEVAFAVKVGRDGTPRVAAICAPATDGADCLDEALSAR